MASSRIDLPLTGRPLPERLLTNRQTDRHPGGASINCPEGLRCQTAAPDFAQLLPVADPRTDMDEPLWILKRSPLFERLNREQLTRLERCARMRRFARNDTVYLPSDPADGVFLLAEGRIQLSHQTADGKQTVLGFIETGELFGELSLIDDCPRTERATALLSSLIIWLPVGELQQVMEESASMAFAVTRLIGLRRQRLERRLKGLMFLSARERLWELMDDLMRQYGTPDAEGLRLRLPLSHQDLAHLIGSTRETVTTILGELQTAGLIEIGRRKLRIINLTRWNVWRSSTTHGEHHPVALGDLP